MEFLKVLILRYLSDLDISQNNLLQSYHKMLQWLHSFQNGLSLYNFWLKSIIISTFLPCNQLDIFSILFLYNSRSIRYNTMVNLLCFICLTQKMISNLIRYKVHFPYHLMLQLVAYMLFHNYLHGISVFLYLSTHKKDKIL